MNFFRSLFASDDLAADSLVLGALMCLATLCGLAIYLAVRDPAALPALWGFAAPASILLGTFGGAKALRDGTKALTEKQGQ